MAAVLVLMTVVALAGFCVVVLVLYRFKVRELYRNRVPGAKVRVSPRNLLSFGLLLAGIWACVSVGVALTLYVDARPYIFAGVMVFVLVLLRPVVQAKGDSVFVITAEGTVVKPAEVKNEEQQVPWSASYSQDIPCPPRVRETN